jgi:hypothetical protein
MHTNDVNTRIIHILTFTHTHTHTHRLLASYEEDLPKVIEVFEPPPKDPEEAEGPAETPPEGEASIRPPTPPEPTVKIVVRTTRIDNQSMDDVMVDVANKLPKPVALPGEGRRLDIPQPQVRELVVRPSRRPVRIPVKNFYILTPKVVVREGDEEGEEAQQETEEETQTQKEPEYEYVPQTRWVVEARSRIELVVRMKSEDTGRCEAFLGFEVQVGGVIMRGKEFGLPVRGMCAYPQMSQVRIFCMCFFCGYLRVPILQV